LSLHFNRLACITAHPDDESGGFAAALLLSARRGAKTSVLCLTEGAAGSYRQPGQSDEALAAMRRQEFAAACHALQVADAQLLRYPDGQLWLEPFLPLVEQIVLHLRRFQPHIVLTFGTEGGVNLHRDHSMLSLATTAAFHWAGRAGFFPNQLQGAGPLAPWSPQKLYYSSPLFLSVPDPQLLHSAARVPASLVYQLDDTLYAEKLAAFRAHTSQQGVLERVQSEQSDALRHEAYHLAAALNPPPPNAPPEQDIWDGVRDKAASTGWPDKPASS
jgi:LmbE family N-acetylglucosaminyl deacetylase